MQNLWWFWRFALQHALFGVVMTPVVCMVSLISWHISPFDAYPGRRASPWQACKVDLAPHNGAGFGTPSPSNPLDCECCRRPAGHGLPLNIRGFVDAVRFHLGVMVENVGELTSYSLRRVGPSVAGLAELSEVEKVALGGWLDKSPMQLMLQAAQEGCRTMVEKDHARHWFRVSPTLVWEREVFRRKLRLISLDQPSCHWKPFIFKEIMNSMYSQQKDTMSSRKGPCQEDVGSSSK